MIESAHEAETTFRRLAGDTVHKGVILQPYLDGVEDGELSLTVLGRTCTHAVRKPKLFEGDDSSRRLPVALNQLPSAIQDSAERLVECLDTHFGAGAVSRARVDLFDHGGTPVLCELECVEPNTNIRVWAVHDAKAAEAIVRQYARVIESRTAALI